MSNYKALPSRDLVLSEAKKLFLQENPDGILAILDEYGVASHERGRDRVQLAILKLSDGNLDDLRYWVQVAKRDYRDVLGPAENPAAWEVKEADLRELEDWLEKEGN